MMPHCAFCRTYGPTLAGMSCAHPPRLLCPTSPTTAFGTQAFDPSAPVRLLRAHHVRHGGALCGTPDPVEAAAATVSAHLWALVAGAGRLSDAARVGVGGAAPLACALLRAAGCRTGVPSIGRAERTDLSDRMLAAAEDAAGWLACHAGRPPGSAADRVVADLLSAGPASPWAAAAATLQASAEAVQAAGAQPDRSAAR